jgi:hypothetical protein
MFTFRPIGVIGLHGLTDRRPPSGSRFTINEAEGHPGPDLSRFIMGGFDGPLAYREVLLPLGKFEIEALLADGPRVIGATNDAESALSVIDEAIRQYPTGRIRIRRGTAVLAERIPPRTPR